MHSQCALNLAIPEGARIEAGYTNLNQMIELAQPLMDINQ